jgi:hypothetical protein
LNSKARVLWLANRDLQRVRRWGTRVCRDHLRRTITSIPHDGHSRKWSSLIPRLRLLRACSQLPLADMWSSCRTKAAPSHTGQTAACTTARPCSVPSVGLRSVIRQVEEKRASRTKSIVCFRTTLKIQNARINEHQGKRLAILASWRTNRNSRPANCGAICGAFPHCDKQVDCHRIWSQFGTNRHAQS